MDDHSLFIFLPYFIACIFLIALHIPFPKRQMSILRNLSSGMYFMHRFILEIISIGLIHLYPVFANSPITKFLLTTFLSFFVCMIGYKINNKKINLLIKQKKNVFFIDGKISRKNFWSLVEFKYPTHQISFNTEKALKCLKFIDSYEVTDEE